MNELNNLNKILIVDTIFKASRLFYSYMAVLGANKNNYTCDLLVRTDFHSEHFEELFKTVSYNKLFPLIKPIPNKWFFRQNFLNTLRTVIHIKKLLKKNKYTKVYFVGLNEFFPWLPIIFTVYPTNRLKKIPIIFVEYDAQFLVKKKKSFKHLLKNLIMNIFLYTHKNIHIGLLDERVENSPKINSRYFILPDPSLSYSKTPIPQPSEKSKISILIVGKQSNRKGLNDVLNLIEKFNIPENIKFRLVGRLDEDSEKNRTRIVKKSDCIDFKEGFLSEEEIMAEYQKSDYVILPYKKIFNSSSGVFANAMSAGKPVIATDHGCIGYRVTKFKLGYTYKSEDIQELYNLILEISQSSSSGHNYLKNNCQDYSKNNSIQKHIEVLYNIK